MAVCLYRRVEVDRPGDRQAHPRPRTQTKAWHGDRVLSLAVGRQGLAVSGLQPEDPIGLCAGAEQLCGSFKGAKEPLEPGKLWLGTKEDDILLTERPGADHFGELQAWDPATGKKAWQHNFRWQLMASVLATGGDLVFVG